MSPKPNLSISSRLAEVVGVDAGLTFFGKFKYFDGDEEEDKIDYSLKNTGFVKVRFQTGG